MSDDNKEVGALRWCSCKASARDGQHMAWCPAVTDAMSDERKIRTALSHNTLSPNWGPVYVTDDEFDALERALTEPQEPTESIKRGAELLRRLYPQKPAEG